MQGDYFSHTVTLLIEHNRNGAFGLVVNKPLEAELSELLAEHDISCSEHITILESGPVEQNRLFFLHSSEVAFENSIVINGDLTLTTSLDLVEAISLKEGPQDIMAGLGYAGWSAGQLENEIREDVWLVTPYQHDILFHVPFEERPEAAARAIGIDLNLISPTPGHG
jgi:putative transcriptional regulator